MKNDSKILLRHSMLWKIGGILVVLLTAILSGFGVYQYRILRANALANLNMLADSTVERLSKSLLIPLWEFNMTQLEQGMLAEMGHEAIFAIIVNDEQGKLLRGKIRDPEGKIVDVQADQDIDTGIYRMAEMRQGEKFFGTVHLYLTQAFMQRELQQTSKIQVLTIVLLDAIILLSLTIIVRFLLIKPIQRLLANANAIAAGDFRQPVVIHQHDEIGHFAEAFRAMQTTITQTNAEFQRMLEAIQAGRLDTRGQVDGITGGWREFVSGTNQVIEAFVTPITHIHQMLECFAQGDLTKTLFSEYQGDFGIMMRQLQTVMTQLSNIVLNVKTSAQDVAQRSREMRAVAEQMSNSATQQASATEEVSSSMQEMAANIRQTADNAKLAENMANQSSQDARAGKQAVDEIIAAMEKIADRIFVVQEIASQTNMLSLNATIEAAKAQEYGKGFTVVASSVRDLARQSREAADEIRSLVHSCVGLSSQAGDVLQRLVPSSEKTADLVQEICAASQEQSNGVSHVNTAIQQLDSVTQHNAATAEQVAATAETLTMRSDALLQAVAFFTVSERVQKRPKPEENDLQQRLQQLDHAQLVELLTTALEASPSDSAAAAKPHPEKPAAHPLREKHAESEFAHSDAEDELDRDFKHY